MENGGAAASIMPSKHHLLVLRHAKSDRGDSSLRDFDRSLAPRGLRDAEGMGRYLAKRGMQVDLVICSPAVRARETFGLVQSLLPQRLEIDLCDEFYLATPSTLLVRLAQIPSHQHGVVIVGHNPGLEDLISLLCSSGKSGALERLEQGLKTAALAEIEVTIDDWSQLSSGSGRLQRLTTPRDLE
jgi:phosphohistidine phosphatase